MFFILFQFNWYQFWGFSGVLAEAVAPARLLALPGWREGCTHKVCFVISHSSCLHNVTQLSGFELLTPNTSPGHCLQPRGQLCSTSFGLWSQHLKHDKVRVTQGNLSELSSKSSHEQTCDANIFQPL